MKTKGLTLIELMIALTVLAFGIVALLLALSYCIVANEANNNLVIASIDAQSVLEEIKGQTYGNISGSYTPQQTYNNLNNEAINISVAQNYGIKNVTVTVSWIERGADKSFSLFTGIVR